MKVAENDLTQSLSRDQKIWNPMEPNHEGATEEDMAPQIVITQLYLQVADLVNIGATHRGSTTVVGPMSRVVV